MQVAAEPGQLDLSRDLRVGGIGEVEDVERVGLQEGHGIGDGAVEPDALEGLARVAEPGRPAYEVEGAVRVEHHNLVEGRPRAAQW